MTDVVLRTPGHAVVRYATTRPVASTPAVVNWSRWIARCPAPYCRGAADLTYGQPRMVCVEPWCGAESAVVWPPNVADIEYLLAVRPDPITRNWEPGETVHALLAENVEHGLAPLMLADGPAAAISIVGDRVTAAGPALNAARRRAVTA